MNRFAVGLGLLAGSLAYACPCHVNELSADQWKKFQAAHQPWTAGRRAASGAMPRLPDADSSSPWGGADPKHWRPEATLANATSGALNRAWAEDNVDDAIVAVPLKMLRSQFHPYGDGQSNASITFGDWRHSRPQLVATLLKRKSGGQLVRFRFDRALELKGAGVELRFSGQSARVTGTLASDGSLDASWTPSAALGWTTSRETSILYVRPSGWNDWFPVYFRHPIVTVPSLVGELLPERSRMADGRAIPDPEHVAGGGPTPFDTLVSHSFGPAFNSTPYNPPNIHAEFPNAGGTVTAVGQGWTWSRSRHRPRSRSCIPALTAGTRSSRPPPASPAAAAGTRSVTTPRRFSTRWKRTPSSWVTRPRSPRLRLRREDFRMGSPTSPPSAGSSPAKRWSRPTDPRIGLPQRQTLLGRRRFPLVLFPSRTARLHRGVGASVGAGDGAIITSGSNAHPAADPPSAAACPCGD